MHAFAPGLALPRGVQQRSFPRRRLLLIVPFAMTASCGDSEQIRYDAEERTASREFGNFGADPGNSTGDGVAQDTDGPATGIDIAGVPGDASGDDDDGGGLGGGTEGGGGSLVQYRYQPRCEKLEVISGDDQMPVAGSWKATYATRCTIEVIRNGKPQAARESPCEHRITWPAGYFSGGSHRLRLRAQNAYGSCQKTTTFEVIFSRPQPPTLPQPPPAGPKRCPGGHFKVGHAIYEANGGSYCLWGGWEAFETCYADFSSDLVQYAGRLPQYEVAPAVCRYAGRCSCRGGATGGATGGGGEMDGCQSPEGASGFFNVGDKTYYSNGGRYCLCAAYDSSVSQSFCKVPTGLVEQPEDGGVCSGC